MTIRICIWAQVEKKLIHEIVSCTKTQVKIKLKQVVTQFNAIKHHQSIKLEHFPDKIEVLSNVP